MYKPNKAEYSALDASRREKALRTYERTDRQTDGPTDRRTNQQTDGPIDGRMDRPSYEDASENDSNRDVWRKYLH